MKTKLSAPRDIIFPVFLLLVFVFTPVREIRFVALLFVLIRVLGLIYSKIAPLCIEIKRNEELLHANRHQRFRVNLVVRNKSILPLHYISIMDTLGDLYSGDLRTFLIGLKAGETKTISYEAEGHDRGEFYLGPVYVKGADPFGFYRWEKTINSMLKVIVYPSVHPVVLDERTGLPSGNIKVSSKLYEDVTRYRSIREYIPGDPLKRINWKVSARLGKLYSMEYSPSIYFPVLILLNISEHDLPLAHREHLSNRSIEVAASLVFFFVGLKQEIGMVTTGKMPGVEGHPVVPIKSGHGHAINILEILARIQTSEDKTNFAQYVFRAGVSIQSGTKIMVVTPPPRVEEREALLSAKRRGYDMEVFVVSSYAMKREDAMVHGLLTHSVREYGTELLNE